MFSGQKKARHDCSGRKEDHQQDYNEKHLSVRTALISKLTSSSSRKLSPIGTSSSKSRSPTCNLPLRIRRSTGSSKSNGSCSQKHNSIVSCSTSPKRVLRLLAHAPRSGCWRMQIASEASCSSPSP